MILVASCKTNKSTKLIDTEKSFISISKGRCLGDCPVYDLWVFKNGNIIYHGIDHVQKKGVQKTSISLSKIDTLEKLISTINTKDLGEIKGRDTPLSILRFNNKRMVYQASKAKGNLQYINKLLDSIHLSINER